MIHELPFFGIDSGQPSFASLCMADSRYSIHFMSKTYGAGQCIRRRGESITHLGLVRSGILKSVSCSRNGDEHCNAYFEENDSFPELLYLTGKRRYTYSLYVEKKAEVLWIPIDILEEMLTADPQLMSALLLYVSQRGLKNQLYLNCLNYQHIRQRIAYWILGIHELAPGQAVALPRSQKILANLLHVNRSSLNQELRQMAAEGFFAVENGRMTEIALERLGELL